MSKLALVALCAVAIFPVLVFSSFECEKHWEGPSVNNSMSDCHLEELYVERTDAIVQLAFPVVVLGLALLLYPCFFFGRQCCNLFGSNKRRPGAGCCRDGAHWDNQPAAAKEAMYPSKSVNRIKVLAALVWLLGFVALVLMSTGAAEMIRSYDSFFTGVEAVVDWAESQIANIETHLTVRSGELIPFFNETAFNSGYERTQNLRNEIRDRKEFADEYMHRAGDISLALGIVPLVFLSMAALFAVSDIRRCCPAMCTCFYFFLLVVYAGLGLIFIAGGILMKDACEEIDLALETPPKPGLIEWYLVPMCEEKVDFGSVRKSVADAERDNSIEGCEGLTKVCDATPQWEPSTPQLMFRCAISNATAQCDTFDKAESEYQGAFAKSGAPDCVGCSLPDWSACCQGEAIRAAAQSIQESVVFARLALEAYTEYVEPLFDCSYLVTTALEPIRKPCPSIVKGMQLIGSGATMYAILFAFGIIILFKGQKLFFKLRSDDNEPVK